VTVDRAGEVSATTRQFTGLFGSTTIPMDMLDAFIDASFVPECAMVVSRDVELPSMPVSELPVRPCGCHFDWFVHQKLVAEPNFVPPGCSVCGEGGTCTDSQKTCIYGFCEQPN
jgi:hypothetical protein